MSLEVLLVQVLVLAFTGVLWWIARRDLAARSVLPLAPPAAADTAELEQLCATLETLVTNLARRLDAVEQRAERSPAAWQSPVPVLQELREYVTPPVHPEPEMQPEPAPRLPATVPQLPATVPQLPATVPAPTPEPVPDPRYLPVYALLQAGVSDPIEIARQTGLGRGEVDLILSLRDRRAF